VPTFVTIGYGDEAGYERTDPAVRDAAHAHERPPAGGRRAPRDRRRARRGPQPRRRRHLDDRRPVPVGAAPRRRLRRHRGGVARGGHRAGGAEPVRRRPRGGRGVAVADL